MKHVKPLSLFLLISSIARGMLELFNTILLYQKGYTISQIFLYLILFYSCSFFVSPLTVFLGRKVGYKKILVGSIFFFCASYLYLSSPIHTFSELFLFALLYGTAIFSYWIIRHHFEMAEFKNEKVGEKTGIFLIFSQVATLFSGIFSAFILDHFSLFTMVIITGVLFISSIIPLFFVEEPEDVKGPIKIQDYLFHIPPPTIFHLALKEGKTGLSDLFSLYLFLYVNDTYGFVGGANFLIGFASILFTYIFSKKVDKKREEYLVVSVILLCIIYLGKLNITSAGILTIILLGEGLVKQFYALVGDSNYYLLSTKFNKDTYILGQEILYAFSRVLLFSFGLLLPNLKKFIYFCIGLLVLSGFVPFLLPPNKKRQVLKKKNTRNYNSYNLSVKLFKRVGAFSYTKLIFGF